MITKFDQTFKNSNCLTKCIQQTQPDKAQPEDAFELIFRQNDRQKKQTDRQTLTVIQPLNNLI